MTPTRAWTVLGLKRTADTGAIRRAYAERLKAMDVDRDVDGYARLREARDAALGWARAQATKATPAEDADPLAGVELPPNETTSDEAPASAWLYGAPQAQGAADPALVTRLSPAAAPSLDMTPGFGAAQAEAEQAIAVTRDPFARPVLLGLEQTGDAVMPAWAHEQALHRMLLPPGSGGDDETPPSLEGWEEAAARSHLAAILHNAESASVTAFDETDNWLAGVLARSWPRSAPLLEPAAAVFGWEGERGQVSERPAVAFLNARLRGLRFREKVLDPKHPLHKAWTELTTPAHQGSRRGWFVKRADVAQLLDGVRKHFPELEHHFDHWRVGLWEQQAASDSGGGWFSKTRLWIFGAILLFQVLRFVIPDSPSPQQAAPPVAATAFDARDEQLIAAAVEDNFGKGLTLAQVRALQPDLSAVIAANRTVARSNADSDAIYLANVRDVVRERALASALTARGNVLEDAQRVRLGLLKAVQQSGPAVCMTYVRSARTPADLAVPDDVRSAERALMRRMLEARQLGPPPRIAPGKASIPGALIEQVMARTAIPEERVRGALQNKGSDADRCSVTIALLDAALKWKGKDREAILSIL